MPIKYFSLLFLGFFIITASTVGDPPETPSTPTLPNWGVRNLQAEMEPAIPYLRINGEIVTRRDLARMKLKIQMKQAEYNAPSAQMLSDKEQKDHIQQLEQEAKEHLIEQTLFDQRSKDMCKNVSEETIDRQLQKLVASLKLQGHTLQEFLALKQMDQLQLRDQIRHQLAALAVAQELIGEPLPNVADRKNYFLHHQKDFEQSEKILLKRMIFDYGNHSIAVKPDPVSVSKRKAQAQQMLDQLKAGSDFGSLCVASEALDCVESWHKQEGTAPAIWTAAKHLAPGQISGLIETQLGCEIIMLTQRIRPRPATYEQVEHQIEQILNQQYLERQLAPAGQKLKKFAIIEDL